MYFNINHLEALNLETNDFKNKYCRILGLLLIILKGSKKSDTLEINLLQSFIKITNLSCYISTKFTFTKRRQDFIQVCSGLHG